jgi:hypothetical protein
MTVSVNLHTNNVDAGSIHIDDCGGSGRDTVAAYVGPVCLLGTLDSVLSVVAELSARLSDGRSQRGPSDA